MDQELSDLIKSAREHDAKSEAEKWNYSVRAKCYASWLDQIYKELTYIRAEYRKNKLKK